MQAKSYSIAGNYYIQEELDLIKATLKNNDKLLLLLRKAFVPKVDPESPGGLIDVYSPIPFEQLSPEECKIAGMARESLIKHINLQINALWSLANTEPKTPEQAAEARKKDSTK